VKKREFLQLPTVEGRRLAHLPHTFVPSLTVLLVLDQPNNFVKFDAI
jgi:hypothetical protein